MQHSRSSSVVSPLPACPYSRVVVVGTGSLGSAVCRLLIEMRVAQVLLVDPDTVALHNLPMSRLFDEAGRESVGSAKVSVIADVARERGLDWLVAQAEIADVGLARLARYEVLVSCTDSALARVETAFAARSLRLPMLDGAVQSRHIAEGRVSSFATGEHAACYLCGLSENRRAELLAYALAPSLGCMPLPDAEPMAAATATVEHVAESLVHQLRQSTGSTSFALRLRDRTAGEYVALTLSSACPWHQQPPAGELVSLDWNEPVSTSLGIGSVLELPWPICLRARCVRCGTLCAPKRRTAQVRRTLSCSACGQSRCLEPLETLARLTVAHPLAAFTPRQLGLPDEHLYHRRSAMFANTDRLANANRRAPGTDLP